MRKIQAGYLGFLPSSHTCFNENTCSYFGLINLQYQLQEALYKVCHIQWSSDISRLKGFKSLATISDDDYRTFPPEIFFKKFENRTIINELPVEPKM